VRALAAATFLVGLLLAVRVMFFGVRRVDQERLHHRRWPLALAAFLAVGGALAYVRASRSQGVTASWFLMVVLVSLASGAGAWWLVQRSAAIPSTDPDDDPRYRFQGHVARVTEAIESAGRGRIVLDFDDKQYEFRAQWSAAGAPEGHGALGAMGSEVVIEVVEGDLAFVEPWVVVEQRL
jgi:hypothetical protein